MARIILFYFAFFFFLFLCPPSLYLERSFACNPRFSIVRLRIELRDTISGIFTRVRIHGVEEEEGRVGRVFFQPSRVSIVSGTKGANGSNGWRRHVEESIVPLQDRAKDIASQKFHLLEVTLQTGEWIELREEEYFHLLARLEFSCFLRIKVSIIVYFLFSLRRNEKMDN